MATVRKAASLIVCAPSTKFPKDFEVLILQRSQHGPFGGLAVYPGGAVHPADANPDWACRGVFSSTNQESDHSLFHFAITAIRETFEECGLLLMHPWSKIDPNLNQSWRQRVLQDPTEFITLSRTLLRTPKLNDLKYWSNWVSPLHLDKHRFDTHFFLTIISDEQKKDNSIVEDGKETVRKIWMTPREALKAFSKNEIQLLPPQYCTLLELSKLSFDEIKAEVKKDRIVKPILPELLSHEKAINSASYDEKSTLLLPNDKLYSNSGNHHSRLDRIEIFRKERKVVDINWIHTTDHKL
ncbi:hypothetical protein BC833DRAFT_574835 [Globomyces pollinis-pini]|nr:hypothetical protein BC833DRAFT_574835 [Globomyces pollinis-pini]